MRIGYDADTYGADYWAGKRTYRTVEGGQIVTREYHGPARHWDGFGPIARAIFETAGKPATLLDLGCGCGSFISFAAALGVDARGVDISEDGVAHPAPGAEGRVALGSVLAPHESAPVAMVTALDLFEHIYLDDQAALQRRCWDACAPGGTLVACIGTAHHPDHVWVHRKDQDVPLAREWQAVSGHILVQSFEWWTALLRGYGWRIDWEAMAAFQNWRTATPGYDQLEAWGSRNYIVGRKP